MSYPPIIKHKNIWLLLVILMLLLGIILLFYTYKFKTDNDEGKVLLQVNSDGLPQKVYSYSGKVLEVGNNLLVIKALKGENYLLADKELQVKLNDKTQFNKLVIPKSIPDLKPGESGQYFKRQPVKLSEIKVGDKVTVIALENIKNKTEFTAAMVEVQGQKKK